ncbi:MAG: hypothetical protein M3021_00925, partial [Actinomycetota bacterium]|nr:hypothetical protein [Actinomycetota bacterium]
MEDPAPIMLNFPEIRKLWHREVRLKVVSVAASLLFFAAAFLVKPWLHEWYPVVVLGPWILVCAGTFLSLRACDELTQFVS